RGDYLRGDTARNRMERSDLRALPDYRRLHRDLRSTFTSDHSDIAGPLTWIQSRKNDYLDFVTRLIRRSRSGLLCPSSARSLSTAPHSGSRITGTRSLSRSRH